MILYGILADYMQGDGFLWYPFIRPYKGTLEHNITVQHYYREANQIADALAKNVAMLQNFNTLEIYQNREDPPTYARGLLTLDKAGMCLWELEKEKEGPMYLSFRFKHKYLIVKSITKTSYEFIGKCKIEKLQILNSPLTLRKDRRPDKLFAKPINTNRSKFAANISSES